MLVYHSTRWNPASLSCGSFPQLLHTSEIVVRGMKPQWANAEIQHKVLDALNASYTPISTRAKTGVNGDTNGEYFIRS